MSLIAILKTELQLRSKGEPIWLAVWQAAGMNKRVGSL